MQLKNELELSCVELRAKYGLSDNPGHPKGLSLKWRNETDWSVCYKDKRYVPANFSDVNFVRQLVEGTLPADVDTATTARIQTDASAELARETVGKGEVRSASDPRDNMLLIFDAEGNDISSECVLKDMKNVPGPKGESFSHLYFKGELIATLKNGTDKITMKNPAFSHVLCYDVLKEERQAKAEEVRAQVRAEIEKRKAGLEDEKEPKAPLLSKVEAKKLLKERGVEFDPNLSKEELNALL